MFDRLVGIGVKISLSFEEQFGFKGGRSGGAGVANVGADFEKEVLVETIEKPGKRSVFVEDLDPVRLVEKIPDVMVKIGF